MSAVCNRQTTGRLFAISKFIDLTTGGSVYPNGCWDEELCSAAQWQEPLAAAAFPSSQHGMNGMTVQGQNALHLLPAAPWHFLQRLGSCPFPLQLLREVCLGASCSFVSNCHPNKQQCSISESGTGSAPFSTGRHSWLTIPLFLSTFVFFKWVSLVLNSFFSLLVIVSSWKFGAVFFPPLHSDCGQKT